LHRYPHLPEQDQGWYQRMVQRKPGGLQIGFLFVKRIFLFALCYPV
jgi:hypothetical protein